MADLETVHALLDHSGIPGVGGTPTGTVIARAKSRHSTTQSINSGSATALLFDTDVWDTATIHDTSSNTSRFVAPADAVFASVLAAVTIPVSGNATKHQMQGYIRIGGSTILEPYTRAVIEPSGGSIVTMWIQGDIEITSGQYFEIVILQASGSALSFGSATATANNRCEVKFYN